MKSLLAGAVLLALVGLVSVSQGTDDPGGLAERPSLESEPPASDPRPVTTSPPPPRDLWHELWYDADSGVPVWPASHFLLSKSPRGLFNSDTNLPPRFEVQPVPLIGKDVQEDWYPVVEGLRTEYFSAGEQVTYYYYAFGYPVLQFSKEPYACFLLDVPGAEEERQFIVEHLDDFMLLDGLGGKYRCVREPAFNHLVRPFQLGGAWGTLVFPGLPDEATDITLRVPLPSPDGTVREWADYRFKRLRSASPPLTLKAWPSKPLFEEGEVLSFDVEISNTAGQDLRVCQTNVRPRRWGASQAYGNEIRLSNPRLEEQEISLGPGQTWRGTVVVKKLRLSYCSPEGQSNIYSIATCITLDVATFGYFSDKYPWVGALGTDWFPCALKRLHPLRRDGESPRLLREMRHERRAWLRQGGWPTGSGASCFRSFLAGGSSSLKASRMMSSAGVRTLASLLPYPSLSLRVR